MADHHGYNASVGYPPYFFHQMSAGWLDFCMQAQGFEPQSNPQSYRYLDLGCGPGFHACLLAAVNPTAEFVGIDFNEVDIVAARELAVSAGLTNVRFLQGDFLELAGAWPDELGTFDYITAHGILSWVSPEVRTAVFGCVANGSKDGTVAAFGYNTQPGWLYRAPFQHIASEFGKRMEQEASVRRAFELFARMNEAKAPLFEHSPLLAPQLETLSQKPAAYLAQELLHDNWTPLWHSSVAAEAERIGFTFVGTATIAEALLPEALPALRMVQSDGFDPTLRQDVQDLVIDQSFRRDIFCRSPRAAPALRELDLDTPIRLMRAPPAGQDVTFTASFGGLVVPYEMIRNIIDALADGPKPLAELMRLEGRDRALARALILSMIEAHMLEVGAVGPMPVEAAQRFNAAVAQGVAEGAVYLQVAAPALNSGVTVNEMDLLMLDAWLSADAPMEVPALARAFAERLKALGRKMEFRGETVPDEQLTQQAANLATIFINQLLPRWRDLGVAH